MPDLTCLALENVKRLYAELLNQLMSNVNRSVWPATGTQILLFDAQCFQRQRYKLFYIGYF